MDYIFKIVIGIIVTMAVGMSILAISSDLLFSSKSTIEVFLNQEKTEEVLLKVDSITAEEIKLLAQNCFASKSEAFLTEEELCYILNFNSLMTIDEASFNDGNIVLKKPTIESKTFFIYYNLTHSFVND